MNASRLKPNAPARVRKRSIRVPKQIAVIMVIILLALVSPLLRIAVKVLPDIEKLQADAIASTYTLEKVLARRGDILDRNREAMATSYTTLSVSAVKADIDAAIAASQRRYENAIAKAANEQRSPDTVEPALTLEQWAQDTAHLLAINAVAGHPTPQASEIVARYHKSKQRFLLSSNIAPSIEKMEKHSVYSHDGLIVDPVPKRSYTEALSARQLLGIVGTNRKGLEGVEQAYNEELAGQDGEEYLTALSQVFKPDPSQGIPKPKKVVNGKNLVLTIDRRIQYDTERILQEAITELNAKSASAIVMDVNSGDLLAVANVPMVANNDTSEEAVQYRRNRAFTDAIEPGSINKVVAIAGALNEGLVTPNSVFEVRDEITIGKETYHDSEPHKTMDMTVTKILAESSNVGTIKIAQRLGEEGLDDYLHRFGFGKKTAINLPGESAGLLAPREKWNLASLPTIAFGQGIATTLVQSAQMYGIIAADGVLHPPRLVLGYTDEHDVFTPAQPFTSTRVISPQTAQEVGDMLQQVIQADYGTGHNAQIPGYGVAGKTGTAQKVKVNERGYYDDKYWATFVGYAPADNPQLVVAIRIDEPTPYYSSQSAAPTFAKVMARALRFEGIEPTKPIMPKPAVDPSLATSDERARKEDEDSTVEEQPEHPKDD